MDDRVIIRFNHVTKQYDDDLPVLDDVSFDIERGKFYTLLSVRLRKNDHSPLNCWFYRTDKRRYLFSWPTDKPRAFK